MTVEAFRDATLNAQSVAYMDDGVSTRRTYEFQAGG